MQTRRRQQQTPPNIKRPILRPAAMRSASVQDAVSAQAAQTLSFVAHDLRNPISAIATSAELLSQDTNLPRFERELISGILATSDNMLRLTKGLMDLSSDLRGILHVSKVNLAQLVRQCVSAYRKLAEENGTHLEEVFKEPLPRIAADRSKIERMVNELLKCAIEEVQPGRSVLVELRSTSRFVELIVGYRPEIGNGPAERLLPTSSSRYLAAPPEGSHGRRGLGLAMVDAVVKAHKGRIRVLDEAGCPEKFMISLPVTSPSNPNS